MEECTAAFTKVGFVHWKKNIKRQKPDSYTTVVEKKIIICIEDVKPQGLNVKKIKAMSRKKNVKEKSTALIVGCKVWH